MLKRNAAVPVVAGLILAGAAAAWAGGSPARPTLVTAAHPAGAPPAGGPEGGVEREAGRRSLKACLEAAGEDRTARRACIARAGPGPAKAGAHHRGHHRGGPMAGPLGHLGRAVHGTVTVPAEGGGYEEVTFDRGVVDPATSGTRIVLDRPDGPEVAIQLTADTRYHGIDGAAAIVEGRPALVVSREGRALHVFQRAHRAAHEGGNN